MMSDIKALRIFFFFFSVLWATAITSAQERYYSLRVSDLGLQEEDFQSTQIPEEAKQMDSTWRWEAYVQPRVALSSEGEAYIEHVQRGTWAGDIANALPAVTLNLKVPAQTKTLEGRLFLTDRKSVV